MSEQEFELYLKLLARCLKLTAGQREQIADELRDHLQERLEDLARAGIPRERAIVRALDEFGDAAVLAAHFTTLARLRRRRLIMRFSLGSVAVVTVAVLAAFALWPENQAGQGPPRVIGKTQAAAEDAKPVQVDAARPVSRQIVDHYESGGVLVPSHSVTITAQATGRLQKTAFPAGGRVNAGDVLFQIDPGVHAAELTKAEVESMRAQSHLKRASADLNLANAVDKAGQGITLAEIARFRGNVEDAQADTRFASAGLEVAKVNLARTMVSAPMTGQLSRPSIDPGNLVTANVTSLATLVSLDPMTITFNVDEGTFLNLRKAVRDGELKQSEIPVQVALVNENDYHRQGKLESLEGTVDAGTRTVAMRAELGNADSELISGLFARIRLATSKPHDALLVPLAAIRLFEDVPAVLVVNDEHILEIRRIEPGQKTQDGLRVVKHGLAASDWVVVSDSRPLQAGMKVEPKQTTIGP